MFNKRTIHRSFHRRCGGDCGVGSSSRGTAIAEDPYVPPLATLVNGVRTDFPNSVEFHLMYVGVPEPQTVDLEFSIEPIHSCGGGDHPLREVPRKNHDYLAMGTLRGTGFPARSRRPLALESNRSRRQRSLELSTRVRVDG